MEISTIQRQIRAADLPLERLAGNQSISEADKVAEASRQFEAVLLRQIFAAAQKPLLGPGTGSGSTATAIYQDMVTEQLADTVSRSGAVGLARTLSGQLGRQLKVPNPLKPA